MQNFFRKTFGGLSPQYYFRQLFFGALFPVLIVWITLEGNKPIESPTIVFMVISTLLYPYSRFVYERCFAFIVGNNVFFGGVLFMFVMKALTMMMCWWLAIFIAPIGMAYLYYHHSKMAREP
ncbi:hypothetical protein [Allohahella sp. A8]|uniref:hypothetical protein n=1 Tax=Allohahella sp. A8 TaxID=3141461 RepID=UPI003A80A551